MVPPGVPNTSVKIDAQWCPDLIHTPYSSKTDEASCGWTPSILNDTTPKSEFGL